ncbi:HIT family protein [Skermanella rosea]|uniref:HIT domain-containing protein n=1 Tax=Skermanella rosea TaxID=1817965 RepID=UPI00193214ED|nr:HIT family protein [Skermanella rosea]UEM04434.1 HIT family protein [Skermanella rosea]
MFKLHDRLAADTVLVHPLTLCQLLCMNNRVWPWLILVPARPDVTELHHLPAGDRAVLMEEIAQASALLDGMFRPDKLNVAAIGNVVPQLHVHVVARRRDDPAWPNPVWGSGIAEPYAPADLDALVLRLRDSLRT